MDYVNDIDKYGNIDTNEDGVIDERDANYQTDTLFTPTGVGADQVAGEFRGGFNDRDSDYMQQTELLSGPNALNSVLENINNGRVSDVSMIDNVKITSNTASTDYFSENSLQVASGLSRTFRPDNTETSVKGIVEQSALSDYFFSPENTKVIQDTIRYNVFKNTKFVIDYQSPEELYIVMRSILLQHGNFKVSTNDIINEIQGLNKMVVKYAVGEVTSNVQQYQGYLSDLEKLPTPIDRPTYSGGSNNNTYNISDFIGF